MKGKFKKIGQRALSVLLSISLVASVGQNVSAAAIKDSGDKTVVLESSRIAEDKLPGGEYIYFGTAAAQVEERGTYALSIFREGSLATEASVTVNSIDMTAVYGEDYEILMDGVQVMGDGKTILEKQFRGKEFVEEKTVSDTSSLAGNSTALETSSLGKPSEEQTGSLQSEPGGSGEHQGLTDALMESLVEDSTECLDTSSSCVVRFAPGEDEKILKFRIFEDDKSEGTEGFSLMLANPQGAKTYEVTSASITIKDDEEEVRSQVSFTQSSYQSKDGKAALTVTRQGAEYSVCDMTLYTSGDTAKSGENYGERYETLVFMPYETEKEIEIPVAGEGNFDVCLTDLKACSKGEHMKAQVTIAENAGNLEAARTAKNADSGEAAGETKNAGKGEVTETAKGAGSVLRSSDNKDVQSFGISIRSDKDGAKPDDDNSYSVEYRMGEKTGRIMDNAFSPAVEVGTYYFSADFEHGGIFTYKDDFLKGSKPWGCGHWESTYHFNKDVADRMDNNHFGKLEYYHTTTTSQGNSRTESTQEIPGVYYQYFVNDWRSKTGFGGGQRAKLEMASNSKSNIASVDGEFGRSQNKAPVKNTEEGLLKAVVWSVDEYSSKTPKNYIEFYGLCAMYKKFNVSLQPIAAKRFRTGTADSYLEAKPVQMQLKCGAQVLYDNESRDIYANPDEKQSNLVFTIQDTQLGGHSGKYGRITGYELTIDPSTADKKVTVSYPQDFVSWLKGKKGKTNANDSVNFSAEAVENEIKKVNANIDTVPYDGYFIYWLDSIQKDTKSAGHGYKQLLKFRPIIEYNDVTVEVLSPKGAGSGHFTDSQLAKNGKYTFHAGDQLDLSAVADNTDNYHAAGYEVSVNGGITYNAFTDNSYLMLETGQSYLIRPIIMENTNVIEVRFKDKAEEKFEIQGLIDKKKLEAFPEYKGKNILNLNPQAATVQEMMKPTPGKEYTVRIAVKAEESGTISRPQVKMKSKNTVYTTQAFTMAAAADAEDNIVEVGLKSVRESEMHVYQISGILVSAFEPIRSTGMGVEELPVSNYTLSAGTGRQGKDKDGNDLIESVSSSTNDKGAYNLLGIRGCAGDVIPVLISNGMENGQVVDVMLTDSAPIGNGIYQVRQGNTRLSYPYDMPKVTSIDYSYDNNSHNQSTDNRDNAIRLYDDTLTITAKVNPAQRRVKEAVFTVYTVTGVCTEYRVKENPDNKNTFECLIPKMLDNLHNGDRVKVRLIDEEVRIAENGEIIYDDEGNEITGMPVEMQYPDVDTGLVFYIENVALAPQTYDMEDSTPVNVPLLGATSANANSGLISYGKLRWEGDTGYTVHVGIDALISSMATPNTAQKKAKMNKFISDIEDVSSGKSSDTTEDVMYKAYKDDDKASLQKASLKQEKAEVGKMVEKTKENPASSSKKAQAGLNSDAMMGVDVGFLLAFNYIYDPVRQEYIFAGGGVSIGGTFTFNKTMYVVVECIPFFLNISGTMQAGVAVSYPSQEGKDALTAGDFDAYSGNIAERLAQTVSTLTLMLNVKMQAGVGLCGIISARGYASAKIQFDVGIVNAKSGMLLSATGGIGIDMLILSMNIDAATSTVGFGTLENKTGFDFFGGLIDDKDVLAASNDSPFRFSSLSQGETVLRGYGGNGQLSMREYTAGNDDMTSFGSQTPMHRATLEQISVTPLLDNAAERTRPRLIPLGGDRKMMVFIGNRGKGEQQNAMALYYSVYDGSRWSQPAVISEDGTVDSMPDILRVGNKVLIAWVDAGRTFTATEKPIDKLSTMGISAAAYDIASGQMGQEVSLIEDDGYMNLAPQLNVDGTTVYCSYMKRDIKGAKEEDLLDFTKIDTKMAYVSYDYEKQQKQEEKLIKITHDTKENPLVMDYNSAITQIDGDSYLLSTYTVDEDENLNTGEDKELYLEISNLTKGRNYYPLRISRDNICQSAPRLTDIDGVVYLTWLDSGYMFRLMNVTDLLEALFDTGSSSFVVTADDGVTGETIRIDKSKYLDGYMDGAAQNKEWYKKSAQDLGLAGEYYEDTIYEELAQGIFHADSANLAQREDVTTSIANYQLTTNGDDIYIFFTDFGAEESSTGVEIYGARYQRMLDEEDEGTASGSRAAEGADGSNPAGSADQKWGFGKAVQITSNNKVIDELDLYMTEDSRVNAVSNYFEQWIDEDGKIQYGENQLVEIEFGTTNSLEVKNEMITLPAHLVAGETDQLSFEVLNSGLLDASGFDYTASWVSGGKETVIEQKHVDIELAAGESTEVIVPWTVPQNIADSSIRVTVAESDVDQNKPVTVEKEVPYGSKVRFAEAKALWNGKKPYIQARVANTGNAASEKLEGTLIMMKEVKGDDGQSRKEEGKKYADFEVPALASGEEKTLEIPFIPDIDDYSALGAIDLKIKAQHGKEQIAESHMKLVSIRPVCAQINNGEQGLKLTTGEKTALTVKAAPWNEIAGEAVFYSSDERVAVVDGKGNVTAVSPGKADIYAYYVNSGTSASICAEVSAASVTPTPQPQPTPQPTPQPQPADGTTKIKLSQKSAVIAPGKTKKVKFTAAASGSKTKPINVSVSGNKKVKAKISGSYVKISVNKKAAKGSSASVALKSKNASGKTVKATIKVKVQNRVKKVSASKKNFKVKKGKTAKITLNVTEENKKYATTDTVKVSSGLVKLAKTSVKKKKITVTLKGTKKGTKNVTIQIGKKKAKVKIQVQ